MFLLVLVFPMVFQCFLTLQRRKSSVVCSFFELDLLVAFSDYDHDIKLHVSKMGVPWRFPIQK